MIAGMYAKGTNRVLVLKDFRNPGRYMLFTYYPRYGNRILDMPETEAIRHVAGMEWIGTGVWENE